MTDLTAADLDREEAAARITAYFARDNQPPQWYLWEVKEAMRSAQEATSDALLPTDQGGAKEQTPVCVRCKGEGEVWMDWDHSMKEPCPRCQGGAEQSSGDGSKE